MLVGKVFTTLVTCTFTPSTLDTDLGVFTSLVMCALTLSTRVTDLGDEA